MDAASAGSRLRASDAHLTAQGGCEEPSKNYEGGSPATGDHRPTAGTCAIDRSNEYSSYSVRQVGAGFGPQGGFGPHLATIAAAAPTVRWCRGT